MSESPKKILLALTSIIKSSRNAAHESAVQIFIKVSEELNLQKYKAIEAIMKEDDSYGLLEKNSQILG